MTVASAPFPPGDAPLVTVTVPKLSLPESEHVAPVPPGPLPAAHVGAVPEPPKC